MRENAHPANQMRGGLWFENASIKGGTARRDKTLAVPCRFIKILAGKCGFAGQPERPNDGSNACGNGNAISVLT